MPNHELRHLSEAQVASLLPTGPQATVLARRALEARAAGRAEVPPKPTVHLVGDAMANAMPAALIDEGVAGCKWVSIAPDNPARGLPSAQGVMLLADATTGELRCLMGAGALTAVRTAAVTMACVQAFTPLDASIAFIGTGEQARSHLLLLDALGHREVTVYGRRAEAREQLARWADEQLAQLRPRMVDSRQQAVEGADTVITALSLGLQGAALDERWLGEDALLLPIDYASSIDERIARTAAVVATDDVAQFAAMAPVKLSPGYPLAELHTGDLLAGPRPGGRVLVQNLGNGSSDLVFAAHVADEAERRGTGTLLER